MFNFITKFFNKDYQKTQKLFKSEEKVLIVLPRKEEWPKDKVVKMYYNRHIFKIPVNKVIRVPKRVADALNNCIKLI